jgi:hypothetical protein
MVRVSGKGLGLDKRPNNLILSLRVRVMVRKRHLCKMGVLILVKFDLILILYPNSSIVKYFGVVVVGEEFGYKIRSNLT